MKIRSTVYLDHQATTPVNPGVLAKMAPYFDDLFGNPHSSDHNLGWESSRAVEDAVVRIARLVGVDDDEIIFTSGATESNNFALLGLGRRAAGGKRNRILMSAIEHKCVLAAGRVLQDQHDYTLDLLPVDSEGFIEMSALEEMLDEDVLFVSIVGVNNEIGTIQNIADISKLAQGFGAILHCDAAQAPIALNLEEVVRHCDIVSLSAHKMYGPKGVGVTVISRELHNKVEPLIYGGGQQNNLRSGTVPVPLCVGMGAAADLFFDEAVQQQRAALSRRRDEFVEKLARLSWPIALNGPAAGRARHPGNANIRFSGFVAHDILGALQPHLAASTGSACTSGIPEPSHVLKAIGLSSDDADSSIRFSLGFDTCDEDVVEAVGLIEDALVKLSKADLVRLA